MFSHSHEGRTIDFFAGGTSRSGGWERHTDTLPDLVVGPASTVDNCVIPQEWKISRYFPMAVPLPWPDYNAPRLPVAFWPALVEDILDNKDIRKVQIQCVGGHGRTGTALAILAQLILKKWKTVDEVVGHFRDTYCDHIVEDVRQFEYIEKALGLKWEEKEKPYKKPVSQSSYYQGMGQSNWGSYGGKAANEKWVEGSYDASGLYIPGHWAKEEKEKDPLDKKVEALLYKSKKDAESDTDPIADFSLWSEVSARAIQWGAQLSYEDGMFYVKWDDAYEEEFGDLETALAFFTLVEQPVEME